MQAKSKKDLKKNISQADLIWPDSLFTKFQKKLSNVKDFKILVEMLLFVKKCFGRSKKLFPTVYENIEHKYNKVSILKTGR